MDVWGIVEERRRALADELSLLQPQEWHAQSCCDGWTVREVVAHLVHLAEASQWTMLRDVTRNGPRFDRALDRCARALATAPTEELIDRLRGAAAGRFHVVGTPSVVALGELLVHPSDMFEPLGREWTAPPEVVLPVLPAFRRFGRVGYHARSIKRVRLIADDIDWSAGRGPEVRGTALDLLLVMANRRQVSRRLTGPGVDLLSSTS